MSNKIITMKHKPESLYTCYEVLLRVHVLFVLRAGLYGTLMAYTMQSGYNNGAYLVYI